MQHNPGVNSAAGVLHSEILQKNLLFRNEQEVNFLRTIKQLKQKTKKVNQAQLEFLQDIGMGRFFKDIGYVSINLQFKSNPHSQCGQAQF